jgi:hypothetical protein
LEEYNIENMYKKRMSDAEVQPAAAAKASETDILGTVKELMKTPEMNTIIKDAVAATANPTPAVLNASSDNSADESIAAPAPAATSAAASDAAPAPEATSLDAGATTSAADNNTNTSVEEKMYDLDGVPGTDSEKHIYKDLGAVNEARTVKEMDSLAELKTGGRRRTKHKKHHKKGGKKSHKKGKSSKKVAKRRKSRKTGSRRSRKQNKQ